MTVLFFWLGKSERPDNIDRWLGELAKKGWTLEESINVEQADRAVWMGAPFILAGEKPELDLYMDRLNAASIGLLKDHAYFWLLTEHEAYEHSRLPDDRIVVLEWNQKGQNIIWDRLSLLTVFPKMAGLSRATHLLREKIQVIAQGKKGAWSPVLIIGPSGAGKEVIARSLYEISNRPKEQFAAVAGGWLGDDLARAELFGCVPGAFTGAVDRKGLLEEFTNGTVFIDDFDAAPVAIQGALLRILSTPRGTEATFPRLGSTKNEHTNVWLMFATNASVEQMLENDRLREDFFFRFEDRVLVVNPLNERPADFPAIARDIWDELWADESELTNRAPLPSDALSALYGRKLKWQGNVRTLRALLALVQAMKKLRVHYHRSAWSLLEVILSRGNTYQHWVGIIATPFFSEGQPVGSIARQIVEADVGVQCAGYSKLSLPKGRTKSSLPDSANLTPSEQEAKKALTVAGWELFCGVLKGEKPTQSARVLRISVRLARLVCFASRKGEVTKNDAVDMGTKKSTAESDLKVLVRARLLRVRNVSAPANELKSYERVGEWFS